MSTLEVNFDGLIGPTHHYGGLSAGNLASQIHKLKTSSPKQAALEGLRKMKRLADLGVPQAVLPPHERPDLAFLHEHGFTGSDAEVVRAAAEQRIDLLSIAASASAMWAANAATVSPSADTRDGKVHFTPANLFSNAHRRLEPEFTTRLFRKIFADAKHFVVHDPLTDVEQLADEGAANHLRLCVSHDSPGVEVFVYGRNGTAAVPQQYPARQTKSASEQIATQHDLDPAASLFVQQNPETIDAGVFHNDVIAVANEGVLLCHELAYVDQQNVLNKLRQRIPHLQAVEVSDRELSVAEAVETYLFNSQLVTLPDRSMRLICPTDCERHERARAVVDRIVSEASAIGAAEFVDVRQSMQNGGGPACLRLRIVLSETELDAIHQPVLLTESLYLRLCEWVERHYRDELSLETLADPNLIVEVRTALDELSQLLELGSIYPFQR